MVDEIQSAAFFGVATAEDCAVNVDVFVDNVGDELRYLTLIDAIGFGIISGNVEPPSAIDVDKRGPDREGGEVLYPNGMQGQEYDEQSIADANGARQGRFAEHLRFFDQHETSFDQTLGENPPVGF